MDFSKTVLDYIKDTSNEIKTMEGSFSASQMLERFLFDKKMQYTPIGRLSGGERRRLYLLKVLISAPNILFLDEPTNDLDIETLQILEDYLDNFNGAIIRFHMIVISWIVYAIRCLFLKEMVLFVSIQEDIVL